MLTSHSKECQDLMAASLFECKRNGTYLEIGACWPIKFNNTYMLETQLGWKGISLEVDTQLVNQFNNTRNNPCLKLDATTVDYTALLESYNMPYDIDFLQVDIEPGEKTLEAMQRIDLSKYRFGFIAFEHDKYGEMYHKGTDLVRPASRKYFADNGYTMMASDVFHAEICFEDWYVHEDLMINDVWKSFICDKVKFNVPQLSQEIKNKFAQYLGEVQYNRETHCCNVGHDEIDQ